MLERVAAEGQEGLIAKHLTAPYVPGRLGQWLFGLDEQIFIFTPSKVGVVLMIVGGVETLYGIYKSVRADDAARG